VTLALDSRQRTFVLAILCLASFSTVFNNLIIAPILPAISEDFGVRVAIAGLLVTAYAVAGGLAALFAGPMLDRIGRKPVVVAGMSLLVVATGFSAVSPTFELLMVTRILAGLGVACLTPAVFSAVGDYFPYAERGRAMSWVITANSSAAIFGVPAGAVLSGLLSWRWTFAVLAVVLLAFTALLFTKLPGDPPRRAGQPAEGTFRSLWAVLGNRTVSLALLSNSISTMYWFIFLTFMGAYFYDEFGLAKWALGGLTMVQGLGVFLGSNIGGRLSDRVGKRPVVLGSTALCALFITLETTAAPHLVVAAGFLLAFAAAGGARFASAQAAMTEMLPARRGTVMALVASGQQFGIVAGSAVGGLVLDAWGYTALGPAAAIVAIVSLLLYWAFVPEEGIPGEAQPPPERGLRRAPAK
jgi:predicted MFS family arabinose efflux permease